MERSTSPDLPILDSVAQASASQSCGSATQTTTSTPAAAAHRDSSSPAARTMVQGEKSLRFDPAAFPRPQKTASKFLYMVEVVGFCNLRCPSCPVGGSRHLQRPSGLMSVEMFSAVLDKIVHETPGQETQLALYNWGEPLLHPELPRLIEIANEKGLPAGLSSNLVHPRDLKAMVKARPRSLRVSVSGYYPETYNQTHVQGDANLVKSNLYRLRSLMDQYQSDLQVGISYHLYRHNFIRDLPKFKELAGELNFALLPVLAIMMNIEKLLDYYRDELTEQDRELVKLLLVKPEEQQQVSEAFREDYPDCPIRRDQMVINHDGTVPLCCGTYDVNKTVAASFLDTPHAEIQQSKYQHSLCVSCQDHAIHISGQYAGQQQLYSIAKRRMEEQGVNVRIRGV